MISFDSHMEDVDKAFAIYRKECCVCVCVRVRLPLALGQPGKSKRIPPLFASPPFKEQNVLGTPSPLGPPPLWVYERCAKLSFHFRLIYETACFQQQMIQDLNTTPLLSALFMPQQILPKFSARIHRATDTVKGPAHPQG